MLSLVLFFGCHFCRWCFYLYLFPFMLFIFIRLSHFSALWSQLTLIFGAIRHARTHIPFLASILIFSLYSFLSPYLGFFSLPGKPMWIGFFMALTDARHVFIYISIIVMFYVGLLSIHGSLLLCAYKRMRCLTTIYDSKSQRRGSKWD